MSLSAIDIFLLDYYNNRPIDEPLSEYWQSNVGQDYILCYAPPYCISFVI